MPGSALYQRRVQGKLFGLCREKREELEASEPGVVFTSAFMDRYPELTRGMDRRQLAARCRTIVIALERHGHGKNTTLGAVFGLKYAEVVKLFGKGTYSLAFFLDFATAFGFVIEGMPTCHASCTFDERGRKRQR